VAAWVQARNAHTVTVDWQFATEDARIKLKRLYPVITTTEGSASLPLVPAVGVPPAKAAAEGATRTGGGEAGPSQAAE